MTDDDICGSTDTTSGEPCQNPTGSCPWHDTDEVPDTGRPSKFEDYREAILNAAQEPIKTRDVARTAGVGKSTLYAWLDEYDEFSDAFERARSEAARTLVERGLNDPDVDHATVRFLLERTFDYTKTQELEVGGDGLVINVPDSATEY